MSYKHKRWDDSPVIGRDGTPIEAIMNDRTDQLFLFMERANGPVTIDEIHSYLGGNKRSLQDRLNVLVARNNRYIKYAAYVLRKQKLQRFMPDAYELHTAGRERLSRKFEIEPTTRAPTYNFEHARLATHGATSIDFGIKNDENAELVTWSSLLRSPTMPEKTRTERLSGIPITYTDPDGEVVEKTVFADTNPFAIKLKTERGIRVRFFNGIEADMGTEPITTENFRRTSLYSKFLAYLAIEKQEKYRTHFGFPNMKVLFLFNDPVRMRHAIECLKGMGGSEMTCFQMLQENGEPGYLYKTDCIRAGHSPFNLSK